MSSLFSGLIVGGPSAGRRVSCGSTRYNVEVPDPRANTTRLYKVGTGEAQMSTRFHYQWVEGIAFGQGSIVNFWVPIGKDAIWAIQQLCATYEEAQSAL